MSLVGILIGQKHGIKNYNQNITMVTIGLACVDCALLVWCEAAVGPMILNTRTFVIF